MLAAGQQTHTVQLEEGVVLQGSLSTDRQWRDLQLCRYLFYDQKAVCQWRWQSLLSFYTVHNCIVLGWCCRAFAPYCSSGHTMQAIIVAQLHN